VKLLASRLLFAFDELNETIRYMKINNLTKEALSVLALGWLME
jgi:hypothetical protein